MNARWPSFLIRHSGVFQMNNLAIDTAPKKTFWNAICPRNRTIQIHWFIPQFAILHIACNVKMQHDYHVFQWTAWNKNSFCKFCKHDEKVLYTQTWLQLNTAPFLKKSAQYICLCKILLFTVYDCIIDILPGPSSKTRSKFASCCCDWLSGWLSGPVVMDNGTFSLCKIGNWANHSTLKYLHLTNIDNYQLDIKFQTHRSTFYLLLSSEVLFIKSGWIM